jgi:hypothetical protein
VIQQASMMNQSLAPLLIILTLSTSFHSYFMFIIDLMFKLRIKLLCNYKRQKGVDGRMRKRKGTKWMRPKQSYYTHFNITTNLGRHHHQQKKL